MTSAKIVHCTVSLDNGIVADTDGYEIAVAMIYRGNYSVVVMSKKQAIEFTADLLNLCGSIK